MKLSQEHVCKIAILTLYTAYSAHEYWDGVTKFDSTERIGSLDTTERIDGWLSFYGNPKNNLWWPFENAEGVWQP